MELHASLAKSLVGSGEQAGAAGGASEVSLGAASRGVPKSVFKGGFSWVERTEPGP